MPVLTIGLTGGIASGKSWVSAQFEALGVPVLDADQVSREVVEPGSAGLAAVVREFGPSFITAEGGLDRRRMREHVFAHPEERRRLEALLHPLIHDRLRQWRDAQQTPYCILSVAILLETRMRDLVDRVLVVDASEQAQEQRLIQRDGIAPELARSMMAAQTGRAVRLAAAHEVIRNDGDFESTLQQIRRVHAQYLEIAAKPRNSH